MLFLAAASVVAPSSLTFRASPSPRGPLVTRSSSVCLDARSFARQEAPSVRAGANMFDRSSTREAFRAFVDVARPNPISLTRRPGRHS